jgi:hypothetical protein
LFLVAAANPIPVPEIPTRSNKTMTRSEIERAVSRVTGETRRTVRSYGFSLLAEEPEPPNDEPLLVLDCPGCGTRLGAKVDPCGVREFIECPRCDALYPIAVDDMYVADADAALAVCA